MNPENFAKPLAFLHAMVCYTSPTGEVLDLMYRCAIQLKPWNPFVKTFM